jgi:hypothetical protein
MRQKLIALAIFKMRGMPRRGKLGNFAVNYAHRRRRALFLDEKTNLFLRLKLWDEGSISHVVLLHDSGKKSNDMEASIYYKPFFLPKIICDKWSTYQMCHFENILLAPWNLVLGAP